MYLAVVAGDNGECGVPIRYAMLICTQHNCVVCVVAGFSETATVGLLILCWGVSVGTS